MTHLITEHGCPERLVCDKGGQFVGNLAQALYQYMRIRKQSTTAYHPQANGLCARMNDTIVRGLKTMAEDHPESWTKNFLCTQLRSVPLLSYSMLEQIVYPLM